MPRLSYDQAAHGTRVSMKQMQVGDLVAFTHGNGGADHIAFYIGNGQILEAPHTGANVRIRKLGKGEHYWGVHIKYPGE
jgi:cell wall-associated NlpC family hydrolase